jgi:type VI secretion system secreted protein Hcp
MAVDMFLKIGTIEGEATDKKKPKWIDVLAWSWGVSNSGTTHQGMGGGSGKANVQDLSVTKYVDASSHALLGACTTGEHFTTANLVVRKAAGKDKTIEYIKIDMEEVMITSVSTGGSGGEDRLTENVSFNFAEFEYAYTPQKADGSGDAKKEFKFSIAENKVK